LIEEHYKPVKIDRELLAQSMTTDKEKLCEAVDKFHENLLKKIAEENEKLWRMSNDLP
jgi:hypothetical protein